MTASFIGPRLPISKDSGGQYYQKFISSISGQNQRKGIPHATVIEETSELPKVWRQQKFLETNMIFQNQKPYGTLEDIYIQKQINIGPEHSDERDFKFFVWHNQQFMKKDMHSLCNDIIENY